MHNLHILEALRLIVQAISAPRSTHSVTDLLSAAGNAARPRKCAKLSKRTMFREQVRFSGGCEYPSADDAADNKCVSIRTIWGAGVF